LPKRFLPFLTFGILTVLILVLSCRKETDDSLFGRIEWFKVYNIGISGQSVIQTSDGGFVTTGSTHDFDIFLLKTDHLGNEVWVHTYGGTETDQSQNVIQTTDGGFITVGYTNSFGSGRLDIYLIKTNSLGDTVWTKTYGGAGDDMGESIRQTEDGGYIIVGWTDSYGAGDFDVYLIKTDSIGDTIFTKTYGGSNTDRGHDISRVNGGFIIVGETKSFGSGNSDVYTIKTDEGGTPLWTKTFGDIENDVGSAIQVTNDNGYAITGNSYSTSQFGSDVILLKYNPSGVLLWSNTYQENDFNYGYSIHQTSEGGFILAGASLFEHNYGWTNHVYLVRTDVIGKLLWDRAYEEEDLGYGMAYSVKETQDGGYIVAGYIESYIFLMKVEE
jgi:hypothetical protein